MSEFMVSNPELDRAISECTDPEQIRLVTKMILERQGFCSKLGDFGRGLCNFHYLEFRKACIANGSWSRKTPTVKPAPPKFEYLEDEEALATTAIQ